MLIRGYPLSPESSSSWLLEDFPIILLLVLYKTYYPLVKKKSYPLRQTKVNLRPNYKIQSRELLNLSRFSAQWRLFFSSYVYPFFLPPEKARISKKYSPWHHRSDLLQNKTNYQ
jgi:hypothetical protein